MVFASTNVRITRFAQDGPPVSLTSDISPGLSLPGVGPLIPPNIGIPGGYGGPAFPYPGPYGGPGFPPFPGQIPPGGPIPAPPGVSPVGHILNISVPKPVNPGMSVNILMWFATAFAPAQYAMHLTIPAINYDHTTPTVNGTGPGVMMLQNQFQVPADAAPGNLQGNIQLVRIDPVGSQVTDDQEAFTLDVELTPTQPDGCPTGAIKDTSGVCHCTDPTKEIIGSACVPKCASGQHRDTTGNCVPDAVTCPAGQHLDTASNTCVPDVVTPGPCPDGQHRDTAGHCIPDTVPPPPNTNCFNFQNVQYCESATPKAGCVRINNKWYCPPAPGTPPPVPPGQRRHHRMCFTLRGTRYCKVTTPPTDASHCITVNGMVWCPRPPGDMTHPGDHDGEDHDYGDHDEDHDNIPPHYLGPPVPAPVPPPIPPVIPGYGQPGQIPPAQVQQIELYLRNLADGWRRQGINSTQIQTYANNLRNQIYTRVQQQLQAAGITNIHL